VPTLCHDNLLSDATIPQPHYLIHWSKKAGVLYLTCLQDIPSLAD
jgi:hypothetical protein